MNELPSVRIHDLPDPLPEGLRVLDVREPLEWEHGHIEGATHIPLMQIPERYQEVPTGRTVVVCKMGGRSAQVTAYLLQQGIDAVNLDGGMLEWQMAGRPMVSENDRPPQVV